MRLAFTSCADPMDCKVQPVWNAIADLVPTPTHVLLLGDQIYMDYGISEDWPEFIKATLKLFGVSQKRISNNPQLQAPRDLDAAKFAEAMFRRYRAQWDIMSGSRLFSNETKRALYGIWDDHDFGWNNSFGTGAGAMPRDMQQISRSLFTAFFNALKNKKAPTAPDLAAIFNEDAALTDPHFFSSEAAGHSRIELVQGLVYLHLLDCRTFRNNNPPPGGHGGFTSLLAPTLQGLHERLKPDAINLIASSTTLSGSKESWDKYSGGSELRQLRKLANQYRIIVISGDVHENVELYRHDNTRLLEVTASGAARPLSLKVPPLAKSFKPGKGNFGTIDFDEATRKMKIALHSGDGSRIDCTDPDILWALPV
jgi:hypothetical protein